MAGFLFDLYFKRIITRHLTGGYADRSTDRQLRQKLLPFIRLEVAGNFS